MQVFKFKATKRGLTAKPLSQRTMVQLSKDDKKDIVRACRRSDSPAIICRLELHIPRGAQSVSSFLRQAGVAVAVAIITEDTDYGIRNPKPIPEPKTRRPAGAKAGRAAGTVSQV